MPNLGLAVSFLALTVVGSEGAHAASPNPIESLLQHPPPQAGDPYHHAHSDFTDPLGRFMDSLAAGAFADARALQPQACATWRYARQTTAVSGRFRVWDTEIDLDQLCQPG
jgi:hypothetical protein